MDWGAAGAEDEAAAAVAEPVDEGACVGIYIKFVDMGCYFVL